MKVDVFEDWSDRYFTSLKTLESELVEGLDEVRNKIKEKKVFFVESYATILEEVFKLAKENDYRAVINLTLDWVFYPNYLEDFKRLPDFDIYSTIKDSNLKQKIINIRKKYNSLCENDIQNLKNKILASKKWKDFIRYNLETVGILDGTKAYSPPSFVQINLTNRCSNYCLTCWWYSPYYKNATMFSLNQEKSKEWQNSEIEYKQLMGLLKQLCDLGVICFYFSGGGEPFLHPNILEAIEFLKKRGRFIFISTGLPILLSEKDIEKLIDLELDIIRINLLAGTPETYVKLHPQKTKKDFEDRIEMLKLFAKIKKLKNKKRPRITLDFIVSKLNYFEIKDMIDLAYKTGVDEVFFLPFEAGAHEPYEFIANQVKIKFALGENESKFLLNFFGNNQFYGGPFIDYKVFLDRIFNNKQKTGFYDGSFFDRFPCIIGWFYLLVCADGYAWPCCKAPNYESEYEFMNTKFNRSCHISRNDFNELWYSETQNKFRKASFNITETFSNSTKLFCTELCLHKHHMLSKYAFILSLDEENLLLLLAARDMLDSGELKF